MNNWVHFCDLISLLLFLWRVNPMYAHCIRSFEMISELSQLEVVNTRILLPTDRDKLLPFKRILRWVSHLWKCYCKIKVESILLRDYLNRRSFEAESSSTYYCKWVNPPNKKSVSGYTMLWVILTFVDLYKKYDVAIQLLWREFG